MHGNLASGTRAFPLKRVALVWLALCTILLLTTWRNIMIGQFADPDDTLRLVQVRDLIAGQGWFDFHQYRINPPDGTVMHWSRIVDAPLALLILVLKPLLGQPLAETVALVAIPLLTLGLVVLTVARIAHRFFNIEIVTFACLSCGLLPLLVAQLQPMRVDHHGWQILCAILAVSALLAPTARRGGWLAGFALATGMSISIELLPFTAGFAAVMLLRWLRDEQERWWLAHFMAALACTLAGLYLAVRGTGDMTPWCDAITPYHIAFFAIAAAGTWVIALISPKAKWLVVGLFGLVGAAGLATFALIAPNCIAAPFGELDPLVRENWYAYVVEGLPFWHQRIGPMISTPLQALIAFAACVHIWRTAPDSQRGWWFDYMLLFAIALVIGLLVWRSMAFAAVLSAIPLGWLAATLFARMRATKKPLPQLASGLSVIVLLMPALPVAGILEIKDRLFAVEQGNVVSQMAKSACELSVNTGLLNQFAPQTVFAPLDIGPDILQQTRHSVIATGHHRANLAMRDVILAYTSPEDEAHEIVTRHGAGMIVVCTDLVEPEVYRRKAPDGLMAHLMAGNAPSWLEPVEVGGPEALRVWRVVD